jgi:hypothetical protein
MTKSGAFPKIKLSLMHELLSTTAPKRMTRIKSESLLAGTSLMIHTNSPPKQPTWYLQKIMWNSVISTPSAKFGGADIKNMYLKTPLNRYKYMHMPLKLFLDDIIAHYSLCKKSLNGYVYMEICQGMYGLPQAGILANKLLQQRLGRHGNFEVQHTPGLWKHILRPIWFNLCLNSFGVKYIGNENLKHLFAALHTETYDIVEDWDGDLY